MGIAAATGIAAAALPREGNVIYVESGLIGASVVLFTIAGPVAAGAGTDIRSAR